MMKRALLLLSLLAVPCVVASGKADAVPGTTATTVSPLDKFCNLLKLSGRSDKVINILRAGYEGDTVTLESLKDKKHIASYCIGAAAAGNKELVLQCLDKGANPDEGLHGSAYGGHMDIVQSMLSKGADPDWGLEVAAEGGHMDIVQLLVSKGATNLNDGLEVAALGGHIDIVQLLLDKGATDYNEGLRGAAEGGHIDIVQLMLSKGAAPNNGLGGAAAGGHMDIVQLMLSKGATDLGSALKVAEFWGYTECADLIRAAMKK